MELILLLTCIGLVLGWQWSSRVAYRKKYDLLEQTLQQVAEQTEHAKDMFADAKHEFSAHGRHPNSLLVPFTRDVITSALRSYGYGSACLYYDDQILIPVSNSSTVEKLPRTTIDRLHVLTLNYKTNAMALQTFGLEVSSVASLPLENLLEAVTHSADCAYGLERRNDREWLTISSYMTFPDDVCIMDWLISRLLLHSKELGDGHIFCNGVQEKSVKPVASVHSLISSLGFISSYIQEPVETFIEQ